MWIGIDDAERDPQRRIWRYVRVSEDLCRELKGLKKNGPDRNKEHVLFFGCTLEEVEGA